MSLEKDLKKSEALSAIDLHALQKIYEKANIKSEILEASDIMPISTLVSYLTLENKGLVISLNNAFIPLPSDVFPDVKLLQFYTELPYAISGKTNGIIEEINRSLPIGNFGISDSKKIYFRYVLTIGKYEILTDSTDIYHNILNIIMYVLTINDDALKNAK